MKAGFLSLDITPATGLPLAGNAREDAASRGVHDRLYANYAYMENGGKRMLFISFDLIGILKEDCDAIKQQIHAACGLREEEILIFATHTHSGPNTINIFRCFLSEEEIRASLAYRQWLTQVIPPAVPGLIASAAQMSAGFAQRVVEGCSFNRRVLLKDGTLKMVFEKYDAEDILRLAGPNGNPVMSVFAWADVQGDIKGILVHFTSHPAIVCGEEWLYSRDYIDALTNALKGRYGPDVVVLYANGAQGNLVAANPYKPFITGFQEAERVGALLAEGAKSIIGNMRASHAFREEMKIESAIAPLMLPIRRVSEADIQHAKTLLSTKKEGVHLHGLDPRVEGESILEVAKCGKTEEQTVLQAIRLQEAVLIAFPGEVFFEHAENVLEGIPNGIAIGLANDYVGYIPTEAAFGEGGYEVKTSYSSSRFSPEAGALLADAAKKLLHSVLRG